MTNPTTRALALLGLLESRRTWSGPELATKLGVTTRTLRRDVERLRDLGYRIDAEPGVEGGYSLGQGQALPPLLLDDEEALAVTVGLLGASATGIAPDAEAAVRALGKLYDVLPGPLRHRARELRQSLAFVERPSHARVDPTVLSLVSEATRRRVRVRFTYTARDRTGSERYVEPHQLISKDRRWYVVAYDIDRVDWRTFRLDRMEGVEVTTWEFRMRPDFDQARHRLNEGMPPSAYPYRVEARYFAPLAEVVAASPQLEPMLSADGHTTILRTGADDPDMAAWWLARTPFPFVVQGEEAVAAAVERLRQRLDAGSVQTAGDLRVDPGRRAPNRGFPAM